MIKCDITTCSRDGQCTKNCQAVAVIAIPIFPPKARVSKTMSKETAFNPQQFVSRAVHVKFLPHDDGAFDDDDGVPNADDADSVWGHAKRAQNHLEQCTDADSDLCNRAPADGSPDHFRIGPSALGRSVGDARAGRAPRSRSAITPIFCASRRNEAASSQSCAVAGRSFSAWRRRGIVHSAFRSPRISKLPSRSSQRGPGRPSGTALPPPVRPVK